MVCITSKNFVSLQERIELLQQPHPFKRIPLVGPVICLTVTMERNVLLKKIVTKIIWHKYSLISLISSTLAVCSCSATPS